MVEAPLVVQEHSILLEALKEIRTRRCRCVRGITCAACIANEAFQEMARIKARYYK